MPRIEATLILNKTTPGAVRWDHPDSKLSSHDPNYPAIPSQYLRKSAFPDGNYPRTIKVTVEW